MTAVLDAIRSLIGLALVGGSPVAPRIRWALVILGAMYGVIGVAWLGVWLDAVLVAGAGALALTARKA